MVGGLAAPALELSERAKSGTPIAGKRVMSTMRDSAARASSKEK